MFKDKVIWVTGASSGIGKAMAKAFAKEGAILILSGRNAKELRKVAKSCGPDSMVLPFDTTNLDALPSHVESALGHRGRIDCLVNNAGISQRSLAVNTDYAVYERIVGVDLLAPIALTQAVLPHMVKAGSGRLAFISSVAGKVGVPMRTAYCAAKFGLIGYADALRAEVAALGIQVHVITPGSVRTDVSRNALEADGSRRGESDAAIDNGIPPGTAARTMLKAMERGDREILVARGPERALVSLKRRSPDKLFDQIEAMMAAGYAQRMQKAG